MILDSWLAILGIAFALGCDAMAVGLAVGTTDPTSRASFRLWFHFGLFQFLMTVVGFFIGANLLDYIKEIDHWVAFGLMFAVASKMLYESQSNDDSSEKDRSDPTRGWSLMILCISTSMDALGIGFSMGLAESSLLWPALAIGIVASVMTYVGIRMGRKLSQAFGRRAEMAGAVILYLIAYKLLDI